MLFQVGIGGSIHDCLREVTAGCAGERDDALKIESPVVTLTSSTTRLRTVWISGGHCIAALRCDSNNSPVSSPL